MLAKKYTNPSSDIIEVLAGLDDVDAVFSELVAALDDVISGGKTGKTAPCDDHAHDLIDDSTHTAKGRADRHCCCLWRLPDGTYILLHAPRYVSLAY